jgi:hypothetical protein
MAMPNHRWFESWAQGTKGSRIILRVLRIPSNSSRALEIDQCIAILAACGFVRPGMSVLDFLDIPDRLSAEELERYLQEHG